MSAPSFVCPLDRVEDERSAGGKAWNLFRMLRLGVPVPPGFVVTDLAFQTFLDRNGLRPELARILAGLDPANLDGLNRAAGSIRELLGTAGLPEQIRSELRSACASLLPGRPLIVRSSAVGEDSGRASFAGQLDSFADLGSPEAVEEALLGCWASCWSPRALHYQLSRGARIERMGVVVQEQVRSRAAGVLFTVSPEPSPDGPVMLGEYCLGHGEALVAGRIDPGRFTVSRQSFAWRLLETPERPPADAGAGLDEAHVRSLHGIGLLLERAFGGPQDVEWAIDPEGQVRVVQSRPITAAARPGRGGPRQPTGRPVVWSNANINENYPDPVSPFLYSVAADGYYHYFRNLALAFGISRRRVRAMEGALRGLVGVHGARLYYNLTNIHAALRMAPSGERLIEAFNLFVGASERPGQTAGAESFGRNGRVGRWAELARIAFQSASRFLFLERGVRAFERTVDAYAARTRPETLAEADVPALRELLGGVLEIRCHRWTGASRADAASMIAYGLLEAAVGRAFPEQGRSARHNKLLQGLPELVSARPVVELWRLSRRIRADEKLLELFAPAAGAKAAEPRDVWATLQAERRFAAFRQELDRFLEEWGFRGSGELMLTVKSLQEEPSALLALLARYASLEGESPGDALRRQAREREAETRRVRKALGRRRLLGRLPWPNQGTLATVVLRWTQHAVGLRERARLKQSLLYSRCRLVLLRLGEKLAALGYLPGAEDVFFLTHQELTALLSGTALFPGGMAELVRVRRSEHARLSRLAPPETLTLPEGGYFSPPEGDGEGPESPPEGRPGEVLTGAGACGGRIEARATVLKEVSQADRLEAGDVLVTRQTDPGWTPVFFVVGGLVVERGGMLSHGAILAREYGIPTVVGVRDATQRIRSGQKVLVDGEAGRVELLA
ncbi:MAG: hypothetical protein HY900_22910 [Deltaproteobacteria bacterium]|nr:hypothetical protein [Deltaproteobacteria bacterium]